MSGRLRIVRPTVGSAHAIALLALVLAVGGGYAVAGGSATKPPSAYSLSTAKSLEVRNGSTTLIDQLVVPAKGTYVALAKLDLRNRATVTNTITCFLGAIGQQDRGRATLGPGRSGVVSLMASGRAAVPLSGGTQALDLYCQANHNLPYTASYWRMSAIPVTAAHAGP